MTTQKIVAGGQVYSLVGIGYQLERQLLDILGHPVTLQDHIEVDPSMLSPFVRNPYG
jgi:hypothetical protein